MNLSEFLLARYAEETHGLFRQALDLTAPDTLRARNDVEAKRRIVDLCELMPQPFGLSPDETDAGRILRALALPYADHPDYRPEWKP